MCIHNLSGTTPANHCCIMIAYIWRSLCPQFFLKKHVLLCLIQFGPRPYRTISFPCLVLYLIILPNLFSQEPCLLSGPFEFFFVSRPFVSYTISGFPFSKTSFDLTGTIYSGGTVWCFADTSCSQLFVVLLFVSTFLQLLVIRFFQHDKPFPIICFAL